MSLVYPKRCLLCGTYLPVGDGRAVLCPDCAQDLRQRYRVREGIRLDGLDGAAAPLYYTGKAAEAMKRFKFHGYQENAAWFAAQMAAVVSAYLPEWQIDLVTYIPLGLKRQRERGFNQSRLLAENLARQLVLPCRNTLRKRLFVARQSGQKTAEERRENVKNAFCSVRGEKVREKNILLVDDIITTGSTVREAAEVLRAAGANRVFAAAAMRAGRGK